MKIEEKIQGMNSKYNIYDDICRKLKEKGLIEVYIIAGVIKDEAFNLLKEEFEVAIKNGINISYIIGVDRKTTTENLIKDIMKLSDKSYMYRNNQEETFNAKIYIFKYKNKAEILIPSTNFTANGITNNYSNVTEIIYTLPKEDDGYNDFMFSIKEYIYPNSEDFTMISENSIKKFALEREFAISKVSDLKLPSISDYLKITNEGKKIPDEKEIEEKIQNKIKGIVTNFDVLLEEDELIFSNDETETEEKIENEKPKKTVGKKKK